MRMGCEPDSSVGAYDTVQECCVNDNAFFFESDISSEPCGECFSE